jgi:hypothetical protein
MNDDDFKFGALKTFSGMVCCGRFPNSTAAATLL